jgi:hypothetical protein
MKITQQNEPKFEPITIVLETREEINAFYEMMQDEWGNPVCNDLSNKFTIFIFNEAKL